MLKILIKKVIQNDYLDKKTKEENKLLKNCDKAVKRNPENPISYFNRGNQKFKSKDYQGAIKDYNVAIRLNPKYLEAYHSRAIIKEKLNYYNGAIADYNFILKLDSLDPLARKNKNIIQKRF